MRLTRIDATDDESATAWHGDDARLFTAVDDEGRETGGLLPWQDAPALLISDVLALHRVPGALAERLLMAAEAARRRSAADRSSHSQTDDPQAAARQANDPLRDLAAALGESLSFSTFAGLWRAGSLALVGPPGVGKTTLAGEPPARAPSRRPILVNTHAARAGAPAPPAEESGVLRVAIRTARDAAAPP